MIRWVSLWLSLWSFVCEAGGPLSCSSQIGDGFDTVSEDRALEPFPPMVSSRTHRTSCTLCGDGTAHGLVYNLARMHELEVLGRVSTHFFAPDGKLLGSRTVFSKTKVPPATGQLVVQSFAPPETSECQFYIDEESLTFRKK